MDQWYSVSFCGDSDSDCDHCRICGRCYLWNCRFLKCEYGVLAGNSEFSAPKFKWEAIVIVLPVLLVIASEHIGHQIVTSKIIGRDLLKEPGLHRSLLQITFPL